MMADGGPEHSSSHGMMASDISVHIKQELENGPCSPSPSTTMQSGSHSEKNFNLNKSCNVSPVREGDSTDK